ncbi:MAG: hypothetical protein LBP72_03750 [Dysgonamonadaceae bacterium]|nr:hypothetical protein [Dysgonamonadaceae bacterium]
MRAVMCVCEPAIEKAMWKIGNVLQDENMLRIYESRKMAKMNYNKGILIGEKRGVQKIQQQYVLKLARAGKTVAEIAEFTALLAKTVKNILKENSAF